MKRVIASFLSAAMLLAAVPCSAETAVRTASASGAVEIYVAPDGDDKAAGTIDAPLATLDAAREKASAAADGKTPVNVYFRGGEYYFADTVKFTAKDSGTADAPITYAAYGDEEPRFTGAVTINTEDFERVTDKMYDRLPEESRDMVGVADLSKKGVKKMTQYTADTPMGSGAMDYTTGAKIYDAAVEFYFNDRAMTLAAWPNGYERYRCLVSKVISSTQFGGDTGGRMKNWLTAEYPIMSGPIRLSWGQTEAPIRAFDVETDTMIFQEVADTSDEINGRYTMGGLVDTPQIGKEGSFQVKNLIEELDVPGEYYVDYQNLKLYFYPPYSTLGIEMRLGVNEYNMIRMDETKYVTFKGITFEKNRETPVSLHSTDNIKFLSCDVKEAGIDGIELRDN